MFSTLRVTGRCNLNCPQCYAKEISHDSDLAIDDIKRAIDILADNGVTHITISGGEPFMREDIIEILRYASGKAKTGVVTNGTLLSDEVIGELSRVSLSNIMISLDGPPGVHERIRCGADSTCRAIERCADSGLPVGISTTLSRMNIGMIDDIYNYAKKIKIRRWIIETVKPVGSAKTMEIAPEACEMKKALERLKALACSEEGMRISVFDCENRCSAGDGMISVNPDGTVTPCAFLPSVSCGNILTDEFAEIMGRAREIKEKGVTCFRR